MYIRRSIERKKYNRSTKYKNDYYHCSFVLYLPHSHLRSLIFSFNFHFRYQEKLCLKKYNFTSCSIIKPENITSRIIKNESYDAKEIEHLVRIKKYRLKWSKGLTEI